MIPAAFVSDGPAITMSGTNVLPDQYFHQAHYQSTAIRPPTPPETVNGVSRVSQPPTPSENAIAGRKRSRGDANSPEDDAVDGVPIQDPPPVQPINRGEPIYGPGMTLIYPNDPSGHYNADASTQSGTWLEEKADQVAASATRPIMSTRKSQRLDSSACRNDNALHRASQSPTRATGSEPLIDEASRMLGISWSRMDANESTQIGQRAYTRWITRHYPQLSNVEVWFENSAIPGYLGKATNASNGVDEYYLWSLDLHQAILVTRNPGDLIIKLSQPHMSLSQATEKIVANVQPVVEAAAANAAIVHNDRFVVDVEPSSSSGMDLD